MSEEDAQWERQKAAVDSFLDQQWIESRKKMHEAAGQSAMTWTTEKPTKEGLYWYRGKDLEKTDVVRIARFFGADLEMCIHGADESWPIPDGEWYGPIEPPQ